MSQVIDSSADSMTNEINYDIAIEGINKKRLKTLLISSGVGYTGLSGGLYMTWYKDYPRSDFHFYNDIGEWQQVDKWGHSYAGYWQSELMYHSLLWTGLPSSKALWYAGGSSLVFQTGIEMMDGWSRDWGYSWYDMAANVAGIGLFAGQQLMWNRQYVRLKFSATTKSYVTKIGKSGMTYDLTERVAELYGRHWPQRLLKDYNTQTYWMSIDIADIFRLDQWPSWLHLAIGYGAEDMFGGYHNQYVSDGRLIPLSDIDRYSQWFLSLDVDWSDIKTETPLLKSVLHILNMIKMPAPTIEWNTKGEIHVRLVFF